MAIFNTIEGGGSFTKGNIADLNANFALIAAGITPGNVIYCYPGSGYLGVQDGSPANPYSDIVTAYSKTRNGKNDVVVLVGNGSSTGSARLTANLAWSNDATHLIGISSGVNVSNRSRIAPVVGGTAFANFVTISGNGCLFQNIQFFDGFSTGTTSQICLTITGGRNLFKDCDILGMGDNESAQSTGSRSLKISGTTGENQFESCTIGGDTITRTVANATVEFVGGTPRNTFKNCVFPFTGSSATILGMLGSAAGCIDRYQYFDRCLFVNAIQSGSTTMSGLSTLPASAGGLFTMKDCTLIGITKFGTDATTRGQIYVDGGAPTAATSGIAVNPT